MARTFASSSWSVRPSSSTPARENRHPYPLVLVAKIVGLTNREIGTILFAAFALANHLLAFARVIVAPLHEAEAPQLEHLWVLSNGQPARAANHKEDRDRQ